MKAIETLYRGYKFRSRLEARWAVFFDAIGLVWRYEHEGYVLPGGINYLPDFYFPEFHSFAEVKAKAFTPEEIEKCRLLSMLPDENSKYSRREGTQVIMLSDVPAEKSYPAFMGGEEICEIIFMGIEDKFHPFYFGYDFHPMWMQGNSIACQRALSARFEFGQTPQ